MLGPTVFAPVKSDINGNIKVGRQLDSNSVTADIELWFLKKLRKKYDEDVSKYSTLQAMVETEIAEETMKAKNSATDALLWLKRLQTHFVSVK